MGKGLGFSRDGRNREDIEDYRDVPDYGNRDAPPPSQYGDPRADYREAKHSDAKHGQVNGDGYDRFTPLQIEILRDPRKQADLERQVEYIAASGQSDDFEGDIGPWRGTKLYYRLHQAWQRGLKKRQYKSGGRF